MLRNVASQRWRVYAWDATTGLPKTGDAANITGIITKDDGTPAATNDVNPDEVDSSGEKGFYAFNLTQAETSAAKITLACKSTTSNIVVMACPPVVYTVAQYSSLELVSSGGYVSPNWADVGAPTTTVVLSGTTVKTATDVETDTQDIQSRIPAALGANGNIKSDLRDMGGVAQSATDLKDFADTGYDPATHKVQGVVLVDTTTTNTDMRGTDSAATASALSTVATNVSTLVTKLTTGITSLAEWLGLLAGKQTGNSTALTEIKATGAGSGTYDPTTDSQEALRDRGDAAWVTATGFSTLDAAGIRAAVGLATANLDIQIAALPTAAANADAVWDEAQSGHTSAGTFGKYVDQQFTTLLTTALTEAYRSTGGAGTAAQLMHEILQNLTEFSISGTTKTVKKFDGSTTAKTYTLDSSSTPTSITETT